MKKQLLITAAILMGTVSYSYADTDNSKPMPFAVMDKNGDGVLSKDEVGGRLAERFAQLDIDQSGTLSADELPMRGMKGKGRRGPDFAQMNKDSDAAFIGHGRPMFGEGRHGKRPTFAELDTNGDGMLSPSELAAQMKERLGQRPNRPTFEELDENSDGVLTKNELCRPLLERFQQFDKDNSGTLTKDELPRFQK